ncbi:MAG: OmpA family protein [Synergistaceae bacterium]|jgi:outer membrane protein OmpA-like peptidoglycan-associated protein|nr:OmpA family protein [Synergistaceae bacterium]
MRRVEIRQEEDNVFSQSVGDLMSSMLLIFILILSATLLRLENEFDQRVQFAEEYRQLRESLYQELYREFKDDLEKWDAVLNQEQLSLRFNEPEVLFDQGRDTVKARFADIIRDFFPRYVGILYDEKYRLSIEEIRIEGHTSSEWSQNAGLGEEDIYFRNMELSQNRTRNVLRCAYDSIGDWARREWVRSKITANGLSSSQLILKNGQEDRMASRRVEFRVRTDAESKVTEFLSQWSPETFDQPEKSETGEKP